MSLHFGTAGVRAPLGAGPDRLNARTVTHVVTAVARHLREHHPAGSTVVVAGDARHGSADFVALACAVLSGHGLRVLTPGEPVATPVLAAAVRSRGAVAGLQVTASHNPPGDNGLKLYSADGAQIVPPVDAQVEALLARVTAADPEPPGVDPHRPDAPAGVTLDPAMVDDHVAALVAALPTVERPPRVALTALHGVGGALALRVLAALGVDDVVVVDSQQRPDPDFPTVTSPNPERPETVARVLELGERSGADIVLALDPDADRCATGARGPDGRLAMLDGDSAGALLAQHLLAAPAAPGEDTPVVASSVVSSRLPSLLVPARGGRHVETPTGFKWLVRAGEPLRYAYEEAIGHCVLPRVVRDKDGVSAAAAWCAAVAGGPTAWERLDALHAEFGLHVRANSSVPLTSGPGADTAAALERAAGALAGLGRVTPLEGTTGLRVDTDGARAVLRPSGTEPLLKSYCEAWTAPRPSPADRGDARRRLALLADAVADTVG